MTMPRACTAWNTPPMPREPTLDPFTDIIGRHVRQPKDRLGFDASPVAHMWRWIAMPDHPL